MDALNKSQITLAILVQSAGLLLMLWPRLSASDFVPLVNVNNPVVNPPKITSTWWRLTTRPAKYSAPGAGRGVGLNTTPARPVYHQGITKSALLENVLRTKQTTDFNGRGIALDKSSKERGIGWNEILSQQRQKQPQQMNQQQELQQQQQNSLNQGRTTRSQSPDGKKASDDKSARTTPAMPTVQCQKGLNGQNLILNRSMVTKQDDKYGKEVRWRRECEHELLDKSSMYKMFEKVFSFEIDDSSRRIPLKANHCLPISQSDDQVEDNGNWPTFKSIDTTNTIYGVSAYLDLRTEPSPTVRVLLVAPFGFKSMYCQVSCKEDRSSALSLWGELYHLPVMPSVSYNCIWHQFAVSCLVPEGCTPTRVAISRTQCGKPLNTFPLQYVGYTEKKPPVDFSICTSTIFDFSDEKTGHLAEFVESNLHYGVQRIYLYDTYNVSVGMHAIINHYIERGVIVRIPWTIPKEVTAYYYFGQILQYTDCLYRFMDEARYMGLFDLDDFFAPVMAGSWGALFETFETKWGLTKTSSHTFSWFAVCRPVNYRDDSVPLGQSEKAVSLLLSSHTITGSSENPRKQIIVPRGAVFPHVHTIFKNMPGWGHKNHVPGLTVALVYHYRSNTPQACGSTNPLGVMLLCLHLDEIHTNVARALYQAGVIEKPVFISDSMLQKVEARTVVKSSEGLVTTIPKGGFTARSSCTKFMLWTLAFVTVAGLLIFRRCKRKMGLTLKQLLTCIL